MKLFRILSLAFLLSISCLVFAQDPATTKSKKFTLNYFSAQSGFVLENSTGGTIQDFRQLSSQSLLLKNEPTSKSYYTFYQTGGNLAISLSLGFKLREKSESRNKSSKSFRIGTSYVVGSILSGNFNYEYSKPFDTLISPTTGARVYVDSINRTNIYCSYRTDQLRVDAAFIYGTNDKARWSIYSGIGITAGLSLNATTELLSNGFDGTELRFINGSHSGSYGYLIQKEIIKNKGNIGASVYCPVGLNFRVGNKNAFLRHVNLFYELKSDINILNIPELGVYKTARIIQGFGLKITLE